ncbi:MAG: PIG-L family deacetylase [Bryobacteraceae bacterium]|nr:PIG-L family deacetylase [Bryobacteraceae bacterium]MDW8378019.1 PIG-L family deacetylase [Bryobacterales bacterium]
MDKKIVGVLLLVALSSPAQTLRIIAIGAHPDDCDIKFGGTAAKFAKAGHQVKFLSVTNGDAGHQSEGGGMLAKRRYLETQESARRLGIAEYEVLDNHDGELTPNVEVRKQIIRAIRRWNADIVLGPRPNDYHPDHRYTGVLVQDAAYMVVVPNVTPDVAPLRKNPIFLYYQDHFQKPAPFRPDVAVAIDDVWEQKIDALDAHVSQFYEWLPWVDGLLEQVPKDRLARKQWLSRQRTRPITPEVRAALELRYGKEAAAKVLRAETFELCEYGRQLQLDELRALFPK